MRLQEHPGEFLGRTAPVIQVGELVDPVGDQRLAVRILQLEPAQVAELLLKRLIHLLVEPARSRGTEVPFLLAVTGTFGVIPAQENPEERMHGERLCGVGFRPPSPARSVRPRYPRAASISSACLAAGAVSPDAAVIRSCENVNGLGSSTPAALSRRRASAGSRLICRPNVRYI